MAQEARMAAGAAKSKGAESFPICPLLKNIFALHPRFPHLFGGSFGISVSDRKQQACAAAVQICGAFCFPYTAGGLHIAEKLPFPRCRMDGIFIYSVIERFHWVSQTNAAAKSSTTKEWLPETMPEPTVHSRMLNPVTKALAWSASGAKFQPSSPSIRL